MKFFTKMKVILATIVSIILFLNLGNFLDISTKPIKSDLIVCLGGGKMERINAAIDLYSQGYSTQNNLLLMGNKHQLQWRISKHKDILKKIKSINIAYAKPFKNTMEELNYIDSYMTLKNYKSVLIVTDPYHSRRVELLIQDFTKNLKSNYKYEIVSSGLKWWNQYLFFLNKKSIAASISESSKIVYNYIKYSLSSNDEVFKRLDELSSVIKSYTYKNYGFY